MSLDNIDGLTLRLPSGGDDRSAGQKLGLNSLDDIFIKNFRDANHMITIIVDIVCVIQSPNYY